MRVLGIDVGLRVCGFCICEVEDSEITLLHEGEIKPSGKQSFPQKLSCIFKALQREIRRYGPRALIVERLYSHYRHPTTLGVLAQVRGVVVLLAQQENVDFFEYPPTRARKSFLGKGNVTSAQVKKMAENITGKKFKSIHTADAFSLVEAFIHAEKVKKMLVGSS